MDNIWELFNSLGKFTIASGFLAWLVKKFFEHNLSRDVEEFKAELRTKAFEHETRFSQLHVRRAEIIEDLYKRLVHVERAFVTLTNPVRWSNEPPRDEQLNEVVESSKQLIPFFAEHRLYLDETLSKDIDEIIDKLREALIRFNLFVDIEADKQKWAWTEVKEWKAAFEIVTKQVPAIRVRVEQQMREILGIVKKDEVS